MKEKWKVYIKGVPYRGDEVIKVLVDIGGRNEDNLFNAENDDYIFYINHKGDIDCAQSDSETAQIIMDNYHELYLPEQLKPKDGEAYYYIDGSGKVFSAEWKGEDYDLDCYNFGNCFHSLEEAEDMAEKIRKLLKGE